MGKDQTKATDHPSSNDLDGVDIDPDTGLSIDTYLSFGGTKKAVPNPPHIGDIVVYTVKVECTGATQGRGQDGTMKYGRRLSIISVARHGEALPPDGTENQPAMFDEDGATTADATGEPQSVGDVIDGLNMTPDGDTDDDADGEPFPDGDADADPNPAFSEK